MRLILNSNRPPPCASYQCSSTRRSIHPARRSRGLCACAIVRDHKTFFKRDSSRMPRPLAMVSMCSIEPTTRKGIARTSLLEPCDIGVLIRAEAEAKHRRREPQAMSSSAEGMCTRNARRIVRDDTTHRHAKLLSQTATSREIGWASAHRVRCASASFRLDSPRRSHATKGLAALTVITRAFGFAVGVVPRIRARLRRIAWGSPSGLAGRLFRPANPARSVTARASAKR